MVATPAPLPPPAPPAEALTEEGGVVWGPQMVSSWGRW